LQSLYSCELATIYIFGVDEATYNPTVDWDTKKGDGMGALHPIA